MVYEFAYPSAMFGSVVLDILYSDTMFDTHSQNRRHVGSTTDRVVYSDWLL